MEVTELRYLQLLSKSFPSSAKAAAEIINLNAILNLPKGTEVFASDVHGEYAAFTHLLRNGSGSVRLKIDDAFGERLGILGREKAVLIQCELGRGGQLSLRNHGNDSLLEGLQGR